MRANTSSKSSGRTLIWVLLAIAIFAGASIPIYRAASQSFIPTSSTSTNLDISSILGTYSTSVPIEVLQLIQKQTASPPWNQDSPAKIQRVLQRCATLQRLLANGVADDTLSGLLATNTLRASIFMAFGQSFYNAGDTHHAEMFFATVVQSHTNRVTAKEIARCHLWLGKLYQADALTSKYQQADSAQVSDLFQSAITNYLVAKDLSSDWVRGSAWLGAANCYHELGDHEGVRYCAYGLLSDASSPSETNGSRDLPLGAEQRDLANLLLANSFYQQKRYIEAANAYKQMQDRLSAHLSTNSEEYPGQRRYLDLVRVGLSWCTGRQSQQVTQDYATRLISP